VAVEFGRAETPEEIAAVQRLRYQVYVEELGRCHGVADSAPEQFAEPEDEHS
jgi:N-acyl-L-homoserine lactone synthetase